MIDFLKRNWQIFSVVLALLLLASLVVGYFIKDEVYVGWGSADWDLTGSTAYVVASDAPSDIIYAARKAKREMGDLVQICDGTADDVQIQAAIDACASQGEGLVQLVGGNFNISTRIKFGSGDDDIILQGMGIDVTKITTVGDIDGIRLENVSDVVIRHLEINATTQTTNDGTRAILETDEVIDCLFEYLYLHDGSEFGISFWEANSTTIQHCEIYNCGDHLIHPNSADATYGFNNKYLFNELHGGSELGIKDSGNTAGTYILGTLIEGNSVYSNTAQGIAVFDQVGAVIKGNNVYKNGRDGIQLQSLSRAIVSNNICYNNSQLRTWGDGIALINADYCIVTNNICYDDQGTKTQDAGIHLDADTSNVRVINNEITGNENDTYTDLGSDNIVTHNTGAEQDRIFILTAGGGWAETDNPCADPTQVEFDTNNIDLYLADFDPDTDEYIQWQAWTPSDYGTGGTTTFTATFVWTANSATTSHDVIWGCSARVYADGDAVDQATGTAQTVTDECGDAAYEVRISSATSAITPAGTAAANRPIHFKVYRDADDGSDDCTVDARLWAVIITFDGI